MVAGADYGEMASVQGDFVPLWEAVLGGQGLQDGGFLARLLRCGDRRAEGS